MTWNGIRRDGKEDLMDLDDTGDEFVMTRRVYET
jgi:hypothetical protein